MVNFFKNLIRILLDLSLGSLWLDMVIFQSEFNKNLLNLALGRLWLEMVYDLLNFVPCSLWLEEVNLHSEFNQKSAKFGALGSLELEIVFFQLKLNLKSVEFGPGQSVAGNGQFLLRIKLEIC